MEITSLATADDVIGIVMIFAFLFANLLVTFLLQFLLWNFVEQLGMFNVIHGETLRLDQHTAAII